MRTCRFDEPQGSMGGLLRNVGSLSVLKYLGRQDLAILESSRALGWRWGFGVVLTWLVSTWPRGAKGVGDVH